MFVMVNTKKGGLKGERVRSQPIRPQIKFPREYGHGRANYINGPLVAGASSLPAKLDQVISGVVSSSRAAGTRAPDPGLKQVNTIVWFFQDHKWKQRHVSVKRQAPSVKHQAPIFRKLSNQPG